MTIPIYFFEKQDSLGEIIQSKASVAFASKIAPDISPAKTDCLNKIITQAKATNNNQFDLFYFKSILATVGLNENYDFFDKHETYKARNTPEDKPVNDEHDYKKIIGHITSNYVIDEDGNTLEDNLKDEDIPDKFHIVTGGVIYRWYPDEVYMEEISDKIEEIKAGKLYVSMEALFANFDYVVINEKNEQAIVPRNDETSWMTKHLRAYGGKGKINGHKIGRLMRDFTFSGKGIVAKPANPESVFLDNLEVLEKSEASSVYVNMNNQEISMAAETENLQNKINELSSALASEKTARVEAEAKLKDGDVKAVQAKVENLTVELKTAKDELEKANASVKSITESKTALEKSLADSAKELSDAKAELAKITLEKTTANRIATVSDKLKYTKENATAYVTALANVSDESFNSIVDVAVKALPETKTETDEEKSAREAAEKAQAGKVAVEAAKAGLDSAEKTDKVEMNTGSGENKFETAKAGISNFFKKNKSVKTEAAK